MLTRIAFARVICASACGLALSLAAAPALAQSPAATTVTAPMHNHDWGWDMPDLSNVDLSTIPDRLVPIPLKARRGRMEFNTTSTVRLNGKEVQLAPGVRIWGADNMLKLYGSLNGRAHVKYMREDTTGMLLRVWILTPKELLTPDPKPAAGTTASD